VIVDRALGAVGVAIMITLLCVLAMFGTPIVITQAYQLTDAPDRAIDSVLIGIEP